MKLIIIRLKKIQINVGKASLTHGVFQVLHTCALFYNFVLCILQYSTIVSCEQCIYEVDVAGYSAMIPVQKKHIHTWSELLVPLVNVITEGCGDKAALLIVLIYYLENSKKSNLSLENGNLKWGGGGGIIMK